MIRRASPSILAAAAALAAIATAALAQGDTVTLQQLEWKYPRMSPVHIRKCDFDGDGVYDRGEQVCVGSIYNTMYRDD